MKRTDHPASPERTEPKSEMDPISLLGRMTMGLLDNYACEKQGYDPYDTTRNRKPDVWRQKRKRA
jgi:hypothetical protein